MTLERMTLYPVSLIALYAIIILLVFVTASGPMDWLRRPLGTDFSQVWVAGVEVLQGHPEAPFQPVLHAAAQRSLLAPDTQFYGWHYPPFFLALAVPLALLPYVWALVVWQVSTFAGYVFVMRKILPHPMSGLLAMGFPAVLVNLGHGHNGFLTASLLGGGLLCLERRPLTAGLLFGLLAYKPQLGVVIPVALLAGGHWRVILSAATTVGLMVLGTVLAFGTSTWRAFHDSVPFTKTVVLEAGNTGWEKIQSSFAAVRALGGSIDLAYGVQGVVTAAVILSVAWLWWSGTDPRLKKAGLIVGALLSTPYLLDYDLMALAPALAFVVSERLERGFGPWERSLSAGVWTVPIVARIFAKLTLIPLGLITLAAFFMMIVGGEVVRKVQVIAAVQSDKKNTSRIELA